MEARDNLQKVLWESANILRSKMDANEYKNYTLGIIFYKYLSDKVLHVSADLVGENPETLEEAQEVYEEIMTDEEDRTDLFEELQSTYGFTLKPEYTYTNLMKKVYDGTFIREDLKQAFTDIERSSAMYEGLFADVDLDSTRLGASPTKQMQTITDVMKTLNDLDLYKDYEGDALGDAYEFLLGQFASETGKKAGEFYTPQPVAKLMSHVAMIGEEDNRALTVYDPACGSGSLLLKVRKYSKHPKMINYYGQELNTSTYNLARMNMILHEISPTKQHLRNGDTLDEDWPTDEVTNFDIVIMNPPYSAKWSAASGFMDDPRFGGYGKLAPKSKADFAFLLHGYYHLKTNGTMAIVLPHGVLFRGGAEGTIRKALLENGAIDTVIGLPANLFYNTSIPTTIIILKKDRTNRDVLFIDASESFKKEKNQNTLTDEHIQKILDTYEKREDVDKYAYLASYEEIEENDFNLNIPRYVDTFEEPEPIDMVQLSKEIQEIDKELEQHKKDFLSMVDDLQVTEDTKDIIDAIKEVFR